MAEPGIPLASGQTARAPSPAQAADAGSALAVVAGNPGLSVFAQTTAGRTVLGAAPEAFAFLNDSQGTGLTSPERTLSIASVQLVAAAEPLRPFQLAAFVVRGIELLPLEQPELVSTRFTLSVRGEGATVEDLQRTLRSTAFSGQFDDLRANVQEELDLNRTMTVSVAGVSLGLSLVYVLWLIRGGVLMGSYLSALPAWRVLDPLPVLSRVDDEAEEDDEALDAITDSGGNPLRGFG